MSTLNTKPVGYTAVVLFVLTAIGDDSIRNAIVAAILHPTVPGIAACLGILASFTLAYYGMPHTVPTDTPAPVDSQVSTPKE